MMRKNCIIFLFSILLCAFSYSSFSQQDERIRASYMLAFGRPPFLSELNYWLGRGNLSITQLVNFHRQGFTEFPDLHKETIVNSYIDVLGRNPAEDELKYWMNGNDIYIQLINDHMKLLKLNSWENERVIKLSYAAVFHRMPYKNEIAIWKKQGATAYFLLVPFLEYYKKNNPGKVEKISSTNPTEWASVSSVSVSSSIASELLKFINQTRNAALVRHTITRRGGTIIVAGKRNTFTR